MEDPKIKRESDVVLSDKSESVEDEMQIVGDQDLTNEHDIAAPDENMGAISQSLQPLENESAEFMRGEVDVVTQMIRTTRAMEDIIDESSGRKAHPKKETYLH